MPALAGPVPCAPSTYMRGPDWLLPEDAQLLTACRTTGHPRPWRCQPVQFRGWEAPSSARPPGPCPQFPPRTLRALGLVSAFGGRLRPPRKLPASLQRNLLSNLLSVSDLHPGAHAGARLPLGAQGSPASPFPGCPWDAREGALIPGRGRAPGDGVQEGLHLARLAWGCRLGGFRLNEAAGGVQRPPGTPRAGPGQGVGQMLVFKGLLCRETCRVSRGLGGPASCRRGLCGTNGPMR